MMLLMRDGWANDNPAIRQMFASIMFPDGTKELFDRFNEMQRAAISPDNAYRFREAVGNIDIRDLLSRVAVPTLVTHSRGDAVAPYESGRTMAAEIPGARFVTLQSNNHVLLEDEPAHVRQIEEIVGCSPRDALVGDTIGGFPNGRVFSFVAAHPVQ